MNLPTTREDGSPILAGDAFVFTGSEWRQISPPPPVRIGPIKKRTRWQRLKAWIKESLTK
jgi:hypothetical protein